MTRRRWIADSWDEATASLTGEQASHLIRVLRAQTGMEFDIVAGDRVWHGVIAGISGDAVRFNLVAEVKAEPALPLTMLLSIFKFDRMEWAIEKCTELGVARIVPAIARRTDAHLAAAAEKRAERWRRIALQSAEQSRRAFPPEIAAPVKLQDAAQSSSGLRIVLAESEQQNSLREVLAEHAGGEIILAIGPEGGWTDDELRLFQTSGWMAASLGTTILRAETAAIAATAITISELT
jgi:16S rRNA (uracil1498-N3)-methyltransferase